MKLGAKTWALSVTCVAIVTSFCYWNLVQGLRPQSAAAEGPHSASDHALGYFSPLPDPVNTKTEPTRMRIVSAAMAEGNETNTESSYLSRARTLTKASMKRSGQNRDIVIQLAAAVREGNPPALVRLLSQPYGNDSEQDGLLIEAARKLGSNSQPENRSLAQAKLAEFREIEVGRYQSGKGSIGSLIQIAEAFGDVRGEVSLSESVGILGDASLPRAVRSAAAVTVAKLNPPQALAYLASFRNDLKASLKQSSEGDGDERTFIADSLREVEELMAAL